MTVKKPIYKDIAVSIGSAPDNVYMSKATLEAYQQAFDPDYLKKYHEKCANFMKYFHKGVIFQHQGSKVKWQAIKTYTNCSSKEVRCIIKSSFGTKKELRMEHFADYEIVHMPKAVKILFGSNE